MWGLLLKEWSGLGFRSVFDVSKTLLQNYGGILGQENHYGKTTRGKNIVRDIGHNWEMEGGSQTWKHILQARD